MVRPWSHVVGLEKDTARHFPDLEGRGRTSNIKSIVVGAIVAVKLISREHRAVNFALYCGASNGDAAVRPLRTGRRRIRR